MHNLHASIIIMRKQHDQTPTLLDVEVRHLRLAVAIAEEGSVTRAGHRLHLTQSAVSHQLSDLESRLGMQLFSRGKRGLLPTAAGQTLLAIAHDVIGRLQSAQRELAILSGQNRGTLRITMECYTCYHWLPRILKDFNRRYPQMEVAIDVNATGRPAEALSDGRVDVAVMHSARKNRALVTHALFSDELVAVMAPQHRLAGRDYLTPDDFHDETAIVYAAPKAEMKLFREFFNLADPEPKRVMHVQLTEAIIEMVKANLGVGVLTRWSVEPEVRASRLVAVHLARTGLRRNWFAAHRREKVVAPYITDFVALLQAHLKPEMSLAYATAQAGD